MNEGVTDRMSKLLPQCTANVGAYDRVYANRFWRVLVEPVFGIIDDIPL